MDESETPFLLPALLKAHFCENENAQMLVAPENNKILHCNAAACQLYSMRKEALLEKPFSDLYPNHFGELYTFTHEAILKGQARTRLLAIDTADQNTPLLEHHAVCALYKGEVYLMITVHDLDQVNRRNIDHEANTYLRQGLEEWRRAERFFREIELQNQMILSAAGEGIYGVNSDGITIFVNKAAEQMLGWSAEELVGHDMHAMVHHSHPDGSPYLDQSCPIYNAFRDGTVATVDDEVFWCKDGTPMQVEYTSTPIVDFDEVVGAVIVFHDVTERRQREEQLHNALKENSRLREKLEEENAYLQEEIRHTSTHSEILGQSAAVQHALQQIQLVAPTDANILITGESGTGKELIARAIHDASDRKGFPMIRVNCAAIPRELFESEFFGHVKGAFTGAIRDRVGRFELADKGTLFLDEVGEIPLDLQAKLLRVLQEQKFERIGEDKTRHADVRIIAATNRNIKAQAAAGQFREDLYFRLNVFPIECAPLRERIEDIPILAEHFLQEASYRLKIKKPTLTNRNMNDLQTYRWPGNVRELQNAIERAAILAMHGRMVFEFANEREPLNRENGLAASAVLTEGSILTAHELNDFEKENFIRALAQCNGKVSGPEGAAALLNMKPTTLYSKLKKLGIS